MMRRALLLFVDGLGLGEDDPAINPVVAAQTPFLDALLGGKLVATARSIDTGRAFLAPTDATLAMDGLPQSATGQTALLTGLNAAHAEGRHVTAYPTKALKEMLGEHNLFRRVKDVGGTVALANAYTPEYSAAVEAGRLRHAAITFSALAAGVRLRGVDDLREGRAVFHDLTNARLRAWGYDIPLQTPQGAGGVLARVAMEHHFCMFEFFLTDLAAHGRVADEPVTVVEMLDELVHGVVEAADLGRLLVIVTSDHGNLEDRRVATHTRNPVPTLLIGQGREAVGTQIRSLLDIAPAIVSWVRGETADG